jgi:tetratricopeptide (TPR) repeat protein
VKSKKSIVVIVWLAILLMSPGARAEDEDAFDKGVKLMGQQRYEEAIQAFSTAIEIIPRDYQAYNYRGVARALIGAYDPAIADYSKAIEIRPRYAEAYNNRGFARTRTGDLGSAINDYTRALELNPFFVDAYNNKAWVLATCADRRYRDGGQAVRLAQKAVELKPDVVSLDTLAAAYAAVGNFDAAVDTQKKAIQKLLLADKPPEVPKYLPHLNAYKSRQSLLINYTARAKTDDTQGRGTKVSLKEQTVTPATPDDASQKAAAASRPQTRERAAVSASSPAVPAQKPAAEVQIKKPAAEPKAKNSVKAASKPSSAAGAQKAGSELKKPEPAARPKTTKAAASTRKPSPAVSAQKPAANVQTPKPAAEPKTKKALTAASKPSPAVTAQTPSSAAKPKKSPAAPKPKKTLKPPVKPLPYTIQVSAYRNPQTSNKVARNLITGGDPAFTSPVDLSEKGKWYRVYIGNYTTLAEAKAAAAGLKNRKFRYVQVAKKPYAVQVGVPASKSEAQKLKSRLKTKGYLAYSLPATSGRDQSRILIGAFESREAAENLAEQLKKDGFNPKIGLR